jgi:ElaB/YqjD/DUF883 family membrane-anchored ribosome-binding protein
MDPQPDVIRQQIEETRSSLTEKLETLEAEVKGTVQSAKETVETARETVHGTINSVKETVQSAKESVKRTFDIPYQVDRHPWAMIGLSLVAGAVAGALLGRRTSPDRRLVRRMAEASREPLLRDEAAPAAAWSRLTHEEPARPGFLDKLSGQLAGEVEKAKDLAIHTLVGVVDNVIQRSIPVLGSAVEDMMTRAAADFGAHPQQHGEEVRQPATGPGSQTPPMY